MLSLHVPQRSVTLLIVLAIQTTACGRIRAGIEASPGEVLTNTIEKLEASGDLDTHERTSPDSYRVVFFERIAELDVWLEGHPEWKEVTEAWKEQGSRSRIAAHMQALEPFYVDLGRVMSAPETLRAIQEGRSLAQRPSVHLDKYVNASCGAPELERSMRWIELLCARALVFAGDEPTAFEAIHSLAQALDLIRLLDDGSLLSLHVSNQLGRRVLEALQIVMPGASLHPGLVRAQIEPRLAIASRGGRLAPTLRREAAHRMVLAKNLEQRSKLRRRNAAPNTRTDPPPEAFQSVLENRIALQLLEFSKQVRRSSELCSVVPRCKTLPKVAEIVDFAHDFNMSCSLARTALALNESRWVHGEWPASIGALGGYKGSRPLLPCRNRSFDYERSFRRVRISASDRRNRSSPPEDALHEWVWDRENIAQLRAADL